ncbi:hypothetical protein FDP41_003783 [Naegleria fowleri]|uniref:Uncharacterized protein n=1 Tax=Naegleria fowleri TaxID=5763 RepID=A0A6A5BTP5_NAEFO|nr:uncharacterized protein FDP41_003783 [Naegleria fowleri]KAF0977130.1 hypothetical protein FDP41_003783 [Naegleria fowleri]
MEDWERDIVHPIGFYEYDREKSANDKFIWERREEDKEKAMVELDKYSEEMAKIYKEVEKHLRRNLGIMGARDLQSLLYLTLPFMKSFIEETLGMIDSFPIFYYMKQKNFITILDLEDEGFAILLNSYEHYPLQLKRFSVGDY